MPFKFILFLLSIVIVAFFVGFNLDHRCDVSLILYTFKNVPIIISLVAAYVLGALSVLPVLLGSRKKKRLAKKEKEAKQGLLEKSKKRQDTKPDSHDHTLN